MRLLYVPLDTDKLEQLKAVALREKRRPQDQAAVLLEQALASEPTSHQPAVPLAASQARELVEVRS